MEQRMHNRLKMWIDAIKFNNLLRYLAGQNPGKFFYVDYNAVTWSNAALRSSLDDVLPDLAAPDGIHPRTAEGRQVIADLALSSAREHCGL